MGHFAKETGRRPAASDRATTSDLLDEFGIREEYPAIAKCDLTYLLTLTVQELKDTLQAGGLELVKVPDLALKLFELRVERLEAEQSATWPRASACECARERCVLQ